MWMVFARTPRADMPMWRGRRALAVLDAMLWPASAAAAVGMATVPTGLAGDFVVVGCGLLTARRCWTAWARNPRYRFTVARWSSALLALAILGAGLAIAT
ncbi:MAG: hypothetical protein KJZ81_06435 [Burkholderiaceae bacterium]|jgi:hypothetical protein|nr:hypothetical protein [Burkholderiaceae bacterium]